MDTKIQRRALIATTGLALAGAGCLGAVNAEVSETVRNDTGIYTFDASEGNEIEIEVENKSGVSTVVILENPDGEEVLDEEVKTDETFEYDATVGGAFTIYLMPMEEGSVKVWVND